MHYVANGRNGDPLIVMLHGFPETWWSWRYQIDAFNGYYAVAVDMPGYGESDKPAGVDRYTAYKLADDVRGLIDYLGYERAVVLAHDWGAAIAWQFAATYPSMVNRLIIIDCPLNEAYAKRLTTSRQFFKSWFVFVHQLPWIPEWLWRAKDMKVINDACTPS